MDYLAANMLSACSSGKAIGQAGGFNLSRRTGIG